MTSGLHIIAAALYAPAQADIEELFEVGLIVLLVLVSVIVSIVQKAKQAQQKSKSATGPARRQTPQLTPRRTKDAPQEGRTLDLADAIRMRTDQHQQIRRQRKPLESEPTALRTKRPKTVKEYIKNRYGDTLMSPELGSMKPAKRTTPKTFLISPSDARRAVVFHEILSAPKATKNAPEMWEL